MDRIHPRNYGSGLLAFHSYCDSKSIPESQRTPSSSILVAAFLSSLASAYSNKILHNYVHAICAWHILYGIPWVINENEIKTMLNAAEKLAPSTSKRKKRRPYTPDFILSVKRNLDMSCALDAAVYACLTTCFYAAARLGEFTVPRLNAFDPMVSGID